MKKTINKFLVFLLFVGVTISCNNNTEEAIFNEPTSVRIQKSISEYRDLLTSSENGWIIEYYPDEKQNIGGFNYGVKFNKDLTVEVVHENAFATKESNMFDVIANAGPLLTFNTYNWLTHYYANPNADDSDGDGGDYEFALTSKTADVITLTGAQSRNKMRMFKLTEAPEVYLAKVSEIKNHLSSASYFKEKVAIPSIKQNLTFSEKDKDGKNIEVAYIFTSKGIKLYKTITLGGIEVREFILDKAKNQLVSLNNSVIIDIVLPIFDVSKKWLTQINPNLTSTSFINSYNQVNTIHQQVYPTLPLSNIISIGDNAISYKLGQYEANYNITFQGYLGSSDLSISKVSPGTNWQFVGHLDPMVNLIADKSPYQIEQLTPTVIRLTSRSDPDFWFILVP
ncbi:DUF4302 domain-containing protein [Tenacibaculum finnmarkense genomovar finnmarkense]|uniref:DUF4302 domain-containing protein n=1 Tax=Tenacibaculum finnmarkense TaxID=2781243 RepID=UPI001E28B41A|nr:DUF4302 domain-containing protein [Tenacibaculum finnmarkense]MCD8416657.1 DUF4302 domain-containing protein [Tenacibaculum finnmarkense genomovar finnmarkense]MCG8184639.1 DUF4302 domain-containing protein [Tenacibaculum finnmarkense genomovar finnmarkense]MCG8201745.1 DUF4302 domain-containing protein [Tenacibaculum finnmarkense genomovar finnmarkense]MCG8208655.1 DUF4302 domain-containing protein [Tenacibaculum finnmarkense genomovar finnmarkense]MCG8211386.1 DUF4302 domain-containing pr